MNECPGIETVYSCAGHEGDHFEGGYITFRASEAKTLSQVVRAVTDAPRIFLNAFDVEWERTRVDVACDPDPPHGLCYTLRFSGYPRRVQRALIAKLEDRLASLVQPAGVLRG